MVVADERVLTNAHVVAGSDALEVDGRPAVLVGFDANRDLALMAVPGLDRRAVELARADAGDSGTLVAIDATATTVTHPYEVRRTILATGEDIYRDEGAARRALEVDVEFQQGWSGSGLFDGHGRLVAVAFAESRRRPGVVYAVADAEIAGFLAGTGDDRIDPGPCL